MTEEETRRMVIVSNRLPIAVQKLKGEFVIKPGSGGLVTAMAPVLRDRGGLWIGWTGTSANEEHKIRPLIAETANTFGFSFDPVFLDQDQVDKFYYGFSNEIIWPLFHDLQTLCRFTPAYWDAYKEVNQKFAKTTKENISPRDFVWVHDYQLMLLGQDLRQMGVKNKLGFFLHIPFPPLDIFLKLPWRFEIIRALLEFDIIGFQTMRDKKNFIQCMKTLLNDVHSKTTGPLQEFDVGDRSVRIGCFPISIDYKEFNQEASSKGVAERAWQIHNDLPERKLVLCVDRLDYTKGIPYRLEAFRSLLQRYPNWHKKLSLIQVVVPSRQEIPKYQNLKIEIDGLVGEINSEFTREGWVPIQYMYRSLSREELLSYYRTSEAALITPTKDGMNLVAKEYIASNVDENGVLILSEFAGAASELHQEAILINPYDIIGLGDAIIEAFNMDPKEKSLRMKKMRRIVKRNDIFKWVESYLNAAISQDLMDFPISYEYLPQNQSALV